MEGARELSPWLLALESSTPHGGSALLRDGRAAAVFQLEAGLRHGRELLASAETLLAGAALRAADLRGIAVSAGPGSYTGIRVGVMAAKALAYGSGCRLVAVSSLAAAALSRAIRPGTGPCVDVAVVQDARRDEVYLGRYHFENGSVDPLFPDVAATPEEAARAIRELADRRGGEPCLAGSSFATYPNLLGAVFGKGDEEGGRVDPVAVGLLGWRQILRENYADPMTLQPIYARRDDTADWRHDKLISNPSGR